MSSYHYCNPHAALLRRNLESLTQQARAMHPCLHPNEESFLWLLRVWDACNEDGFYELWDRHEHDLDRIVASMASLKCEALLPACAIMQWICRGDTLIAAQWKDRERETIEICGSLDRQIAEQLPAFEEELLRLVHDRGLTSDRSLRA